VCVYWIVLPVQRVLDLCDFFYSFFIIIGSKIGVLMTMSLTLKCKFRLISLYVYVEFLYGVHVFSFVCDM